jgi:Tfp pilus assembly protein PilO
VSLRFDPWRRRIALWLPALVFFLAALGALLAYPLRFAGRAEVTQEELTEARQELAELGRQRQDIESRFSDITGTRRAVGHFYEERLSTESARLTRVIAEVKDLASRAGMQPQQISYPTEALEEFGLRRRSFVFQVDGSYADLRKFINLLELSDSFLTLEQVGLSGAAGGQLSIQLRLSTLFAVDGTSPLEET